MVAPRLKAVVFDLDHAWSGVLGEDGIDGVEVHTGHAAIHRRAVAFADEGLFVGACFKERGLGRQDVFARRATEFPLTLDRVAARAVSWSQGFGSSADRG